MAEKIVSPGVFTNEIDQSFLPAAVAEIGAAIVGPTVKGPHLVPTVVTSYSEYVQNFGDTFTSGSSTQAYLTSVAAKEYLKSADKLTVIRILDGSPTSARAFVTTGSMDSVTDHTGFTSSNKTGMFREDAATFDLHTLAEGSLQNTNKSGSTNFSGPAYETNDGLLLSGSKHNISWEISTINRSKGTFTLLVRQGNDTNKRKQILETWNNLSLDPGENNYVSKVIGDSYWTIAGTESEPYLTPSGQYSPQSKYVRVGTVYKKTKNYIDENGNIRDNALSASLPGLNSGSFGGASDGFYGYDALGNLGGSSTVAGDWYENIGANSQGFNPATANEGKTAYIKALNLLSNQDEYDVNMILLPGIIDSQHSAVTAKAIDVCEDRGDCFVIVDPVVHGSTITQAKNQATTHNSSYASVYWPWVQVANAELGRNLWVPPSVPLAGVYSFNDKVAAPWFAPAGLNRGGIDIAIQAERKLTQTNRDDLYDSNVNPIATFPGQGVTVFGQKTMQKKASALDRINVRRLLIKVKKFIASSSRFLVFEQNTAATRRRFLNIAQPYLEQVQSQSGLNAFRVVMDETNNTPDTIDRNILYGQLFLQPTRTAEFIVLDFTVQPTGASFPE